MTATQNDIPQTVSKKTCTKIAEQIFPEQTAPSVRRISRLLGGVSADVYRLNVEFGDGKQTSIVLRAHRDSHSGHPAALEHQLLKSLHQHGLPVPQPLHVDTSCSLLPQPFLVIEFITGTSAIPEKKKSVYIDHMARQLAAIHATATTNLPQLPQRLDPIPEVFDYLPDDSQWEGLRAHLHTRSDTGYTQAPKLLHGDFWPENLLWHDDQVAAVLDWEDAALGDPLSDLAAARVELRYQLGAAVMDDFTAAYRRHLPSGQPIDPIRLALWQVYVAAAAQKYMGLWGLEATREAHMRAEALNSIREAGTVLMGTDF